MCNVSALNSPDEITVGSSHFYADEGNSIILNLSIL